MSNQQRKAVFMKYLGSQYRIESEPDATLRLELLEVADLESACAEKEHFSLIFRGPLDYVLPEERYRLAHVAMGAFDLVLAPVGMDPNGLLYKAVITGESDRNL